VPTKGCRASVDDDDSLDKGAYCSGYVGKVLKTGAQEFQRFLCPYHKH
jgi:hypothetical protein